MSNLYYNPYSKYRPVWFSGLYHWGCIADKIWCRIVFDIHSYQPYSELELYMSSWACSSNRVILLMTIWFGVHYSCPVGQKKLHLFIISITLDKPRSMLIIFLAHRYLNEFPIPCILHMFCRLKHCLHCSRSQHKLYVDVHHALQ